MASLSAFYHIQRWMTRWWWGFVNDLHCSQHHPRERSKCSHAVPIYFVLCTGVSMATPVWVSNHVYNRFALLFCALWPPDIVEEIRRTQGERVNKFKGWPAGCGVDNLIFVVSHTPQSHTSFYQKMHKQQSPFFPPEMLLNRLEEFSEERQSWMTTLAVVR